MVKVNLKAKAFQLFDKGKHPSSPEVKALGLKPSTRYSYYSNWNKGKGEGGEASKSDKVSLPGGATIGAYKPDVSGAGEKPEADKAESDAAGGGTKPENETTGAESESAVKPTIPVNTGEDHEHASIPGKIVGTGIPVSVVLSIKSLALFEVAHSISPKLTLDKFLDDCIEDFFQGRGKDLGLVEIGGRND